MKEYWNPRLQMDTAGVIHMDDKVKESELIGKVHSAVYHQYRKLATGSFSAYSGMPAKEICYSSRCVG